MAIINLVCISTNPRPPSFLQTLHHHHRASSSSLSLSLPLGRCSIAQFLHSPCFASRRRGGPGSGSREEKLHPMASSYDLGVGSGGDNGDNGDNGGEGGSGGGDGNSGGDGQSGNDPALPSPSSSLLAWYLTLLDKSPVPTKSITAAIITFFGDLFSQLVIEKNGRVDWKRVAVFTSLGLALVGPTLHFWYLILSRMVSGSGPLNAGIRLALDQFVFSPIFIGVFFSSLLTLEGRTSDIIPKLRQDWLISVVTNWKIWIPFQFLNFLVVPQQLQVLAANVISLAWNVYLSFTTHTTVPQPPVRVSND